MQNPDQLKILNAYHYMSYDDSYKEKISLALGECAGWLTTLNLLKEESYSLKTKLSETLDSNTDKDLVGDAENFHNLIILRDEYIRDFASDIKSQEKKLNEVLLKDNADRQWIKIQQKLRNEIAYLEEDFTKMRDNFYHKFLKKAT